MNIFTRPVPKAAPPGPPPAAADAPAVPEAGDGWVAPWPRVDATFTALVGLIFTAFAMTSGGGSGSQLAHTTAYGVLATLLASFAFEARGGFKNLIRPDLVGILALYYLTLYEFLFPQPYFDSSTKGVHSVYLGLWAVLIGFIGLFIGRHLVPRGRQPFEQVMTRPVPPGWLVGVMWFCFFAGFLHVLLGVEFDLTRIIPEMMKSRFEVPWARGRLGDWRALINELSLLLYLVPPIVGLMFGRRERYSSPSLVLALLAYLWLLFFGFTAGARTVFAAYLVTFLIAFTFSSPPQRRTQVLAVAAICAVMIIMATKLMLDMRGLGMKRWLEKEASAKVSRFHSYVFVDDNLVAISVIADYFPDRNGGQYLGLEIPYLTLIRPIPRALWPGKPTGSSVSVESIFKVKGMTIAATFVGEAYMSGGLFAVAIEAILLGILASFWNRCASPKNSELGLLVYASGFFAVTITMRSGTALTTAVLPSVAAILIGKYLVPRIRGRFKPRSLPPVRPPGQRQAQPPAG